MSSRSSKNSETPFYVLPPTRRSSSEILREAKADLQIMAARRVSIPCSKDSSTSNSRPTSSISNASYSSESSVGRPLSGIRLKPLETKSVFPKKPVSNTKPEAHVMRQLSIDKESLHSDESSATVISPVYTAEKLAPLHNKGKISTESVPLDRSYNGHAGGDSEAQQMEDFNSEIKRYIPQLEKIVHAGKSKNESQAVQVVVKLYQTLEDEDMFKVQFKGRSSILKQLFHLMDTHYPVLALHVVKLVLQMEVNDKNLASVCKMLDKLCQEEKNVVEFLSYGLLGQLVEATKSVLPEDNINAINYSTSLLSRLSSVALLIDLLAEFKCHILLIQHLRNLNDIDSDSVMNKCAPIALNITKAFNNLIENTLVRQTLLNNALCEHLLQCLDKYCSAVDIFTSAVELLSKIADTEDGCEAILRSGYNIGTILTTAFKLHGSSSSVMLQISFVIGNALALDSNISPTLYATSGFIEILCGLLNDVKIQLECIQTTDSSFNKKSNTSANCHGEIYSETITKMVRIIANMGLDQSVGCLLCTNDDCISLLLELIDFFKQKGCEIDNVLEPLACTLYAMNNITYYMTENNEFNDYSTRITNVVLPFLNEIDSCLEVRIEACNILLNLTRSSQVRSFILRKNLIPVFVKLLSDSENLIAIGGYSILMNLLLEKGARGPFYIEQGVTKLLHKLQLSLCRDWKTAALLCQVMWNYCSTDGGPKKPLTDPEIRFLIKTLRYFTGSSAVLQYDGEDSRVEWEMEFCPPGKKLLKLLVNYSVS